MTSTKSPSLMMKEALFNEAKASRFVLDTKNEKQYIQLSGEFVRILDDDVDFSPDEKYVSIGRNPFSREAIVLDPTSAKLTTLYDTLRKSLASGDGEFNILKKVIETSRNMFTDLDTKPVVKNWGGETDSIFATLPSSLVFIDAFIDKKIGVCRHHALLIGYLVSRLKKDKVISSGKIYITRGPGNSSGAEWYHTWIIYLPDIRDRKPIDAYWLDAAQFDKPYLLLENQDFLATKFGQDNVEYCIFNYLANWQPPGVSYSFDLTTRTCLYKKPDEVTTAGFVRELGIGGFGAVSLMQAGCKVYAIKEFTYHSRNYCTRFSLTTSDDVIKKIILRGFITTFQEARINYELDGIGAAFVKPQPIVIEEKEVDARVDDNKPELGTKKDRRKVVTSYPHLSLCMKYVHGRQLDEYKFGSVQEIMMTATEIIRAVRKIHKKNILHLDIKRGNILIDKNSKTGSLRIELIDRSLSRFTGEVLKIQDLNLTYQPPEFKGRTEIKPVPAHDAYNTGFVLNEILAENRGLFLPHIATKVKNIADEMKENKISLEAAETKCLKLVIDFAVERITTKTPSLQATEFKTILNEFNDNEDCVLLCEALPILFILKLLKDYTIIKIVPKIFLLNFLTLISSDKTILHEIHFNKIYAELLDDQKQKLFAVVKIYILNKPELEQFSTLLRILEITQKSENLLRLFSKENWQTFLKNANVRNQLNTTVRVKNEVIHHLLRNRIEELAQNFSLFANQIALATSYLVEFADNPGESKLPSTFYNPAIRVVSQLYDETTRSVDVGFTELCKKININMGTLFKALLLLPEKIMGDFLTLLNHHDFLLDSVRANNLIFFDYVRHTTHTIRQIVLTKLCEFDAENCLRRFSLPEYIDRWAYLQRYLLDLRKDQLSDKTYITNGLSQRIFSSVPWEQGKGATRLAENAENKKFDAEDFFIILRPLTPGQIYSFLLHNHLSLLHFIKKNDFISKFHDTTLEIKKGLFNCLNVLFEEMLREIEISPETDIYKLCICVESIDKLEQLERNSSDQETIIGNFKRLFSKKEELAVTDIELEKLILSCFSRNIEKFKKLPDRIKEILLKFLLLRLIKESKLDNHYSINNWCYCQYVLIELTHIQKIKAESKEYKTVSNHILYTNVLIDCQSMFDNINIVNNGLDYFIDILLKQEISLLTLLNNNNSLQQKSLLNALHLRNPLLLSTLYPLSHSFFDSLPFPNLDKVEFINIWLDSKKCSVLTESKIPLQERYDQWYYFEVLANELKTTPNQWRETLNRCAEWKMDAGVARYSETIIKESGKNLLKVCLGPSPMYLLEGLGRKRVRQILSSEEKIAPRLGQYSKTKDLFFQLMEGVPSTQRSEFLRWIREDNYLKHIASGLPFTQYCTVIRQIDKAFGINSPEAIAIHKEFALRLLSEHGNDFRSATKFAAKWVDEPIYKRIILELCDLYYGKRQREMTFFTTWKKTELSTCEKLKSALSDGTGILLTPDEKAAANSGDLRYLKNAFRKSGINF